MRCSIRTVGLRVLVLLFAFTLGVSLTRIVRYTHYTCAETALERLDYASLETVNMCDLMIAPGRYEGKVLLLNIKPYQGRMIRADELCLCGDPKFHMEFVTGDRRLAGTEAFWGGGEVTMVGRFSKRPEASDARSYQFEVFRIVAARLSVSE